MWMPSEQEFRLLRMLGLVTMALIFGARVVPPLQPHARLIESLRHGLGTRAARNLARLHAFARVEQAGDVRRKLRSETLQILCAPISRMFAGANAFEHQPAHQLMRLMERSSGARQCFGEIRRHHPAFVGSLSRNRRRLILPRFWVRAMISLPG